MIPSMIFAVILCLSICAARGRRKATMILQILALIMVTALFVHHATDSLNLSF